MTNPTRNRIKRLAVVAAGSVVLLGLLTIALYRFVPRDTPSGQPPLTHLSATNFAELKSAFNAATGEVRVLALLSPT